MVDKVDKMGCGGGGDVGIDHDCGGAQDTGRLLCEVTTRTARGATVENACRVRFE